MQRSKAIIMVLVAMLAVAGGQYYGQVRLAKQYENTLFAILNHSLVTTHLLLQDALEETDPAARKELIIDASWNALPAHRILRDDFKVLQYDSPDVLMYWLLGEDSETLNYPDPITDEYVTAYRDRIGKLRLAKFEGTRQLSVEELRVRVSQLADELGLRQLYAR